MNEAKELIKPHYRPCKTLSEKILNVKSPWDHRPISDISLMSQADADAALTRARGRLNSKKGLAPLERLAILRKTAELLKTQRAAFADLIALEGGKPLRDALVEVDRAVVSLELAAEEGVRVHGQEIPMRRTAAAASHLAFTFPEPIGIVLAISAFNHPVNLIAHQVGPAIAAGCPVLIKPALETPLSCLHLLDLLYQAGLPEDEAQPLIAENEVVESLVRSPQISFLSFIGSAKVGWYLRTQIAPGTRFALEHGGSAPAIVDRTADLAKAVPAIVKGGYYHAGQVCVSTQRVYVDSEILREFRGELTKAVENLKTGDPRLSDTDCGPIIRERDMERIEKSINESVGKGAKIHVGGKRLGRTCFEPTVLVDVPQDASAIQDEIFGPVLAVNSFTSIDEAIEAANLVRWQFQAAVFGNDLDRMLKVGRRLRASAVMVNESTAFRVDWMPFRGDGPSGYGTGGIGYAVHDLVRQKMLVIKSDS